MKKFFVLLSCMFLMHGISAQSLLDIYKKGAVKLTPDAEYAQGNNWEKVFETYYDSLFINIPNIRGYWIGDRKSIVIMPDGSVVVNHANRNFYSLFDAKGKFVKEFGITNSSGKRLQKAQAICGVMNNNFYTLPDNMGKAIFANFNGNHVKTLNFDHSVHDMIPLNNNKIAIVGWVIWSDRFRDFVAIVDYQTNEQKIIWDYFTILNTRIDDSSEGVIFESARINTRPSIAFTNNQLIVALPHSGEILFYDVNGALKSKQKLDWQRKYLSVEEQKENMRKSMEGQSLRKKELQESGETQSEKIRRIDVFLQLMKESMEKITEPRPLPMFANVIKDSEGNLLFFEVPEKEGANQFNVWVYNDGKFVAKSSFVNEDFDLSITPTKMVFHNGYIYALQTLKNTQGNPLRLVRFKVGN